MRHQVLRTKWYKACCFDDLLGNSVLGKRPGTISLFGICHCVHHSYTRASHNVCGNWRRRTIGPPSVLVRPYDDEMVEEVVEAPRSNRSPAALELSESTSATA